ncbi:Fic family protein [Candidatus Dependentiae bacterium]|nr:Fic family protein [Candidatus Dependentiae bacterium]
MNLFKNILALTLLLPSFLNGMQKELPVPLQENTKPLKRFPGYYYFNVHPEIEMPEGEITREKLVDLLHNSTLSSKQKIEYLNFWAALLVAEVVLLNKPIKSWTLSDLQKINALLMHDLNPDDLTILSVKNYNLGKWKDKNIFMDRFTIDENFLAAQDPEIKALVITTHEKASDLPQDQRLDQYLTKEELDCYDECWIRFSDIQDVPVHMNDYLETLSNMEKKNCSCFELASYAHTRLTLIHPFLNGSGRLARIIASIFLMKKGAIPLVVQNQEFYLTAVRNGNIDPASFTRLLETLMEIQKNIYSTLTDFEGVPSTESLNKEYSFSVTQAFNKLSPDSTSFIADIEELKIFCLKQANLFYRSCFKCNRYEKQSWTFKHCARCKKTFYCSAKCQKQDWQSHKQTCACVK